MALREEFERTGAWLFKRRGTLPLFLTGFFLIGLSQGPFGPENTRGFQLWEVLCVAVSLLGLGIRCYTIGHASRGTHGRNTRKQKAATLNVDGIYSIVRNPLYLGNFFCSLGIALYVRVWWIVLIYILIFWLYYERILFAEEAYLRKKFETEFEHWAEKTPAFIPRMRNRVPSSNPFSWRSVLKREYAVLFGIVISFVALELFSGLFAEGKLNLDPAWIAFFCSGLLVYLTFRTLHKKTALLKHKIQR